MFEKKMGLLSDVDLSTISSCSLTSEEIEDATAATAGAAAIGCAVAAAFAA
ncbi:MAG TPA: hypothetical protein GX717_02440 [Clostridiaceae bacterium]|nr:hypothetical protein [Clostridiaceae bacterium]